MDLVEAARADPDAQPVALVDDVVAATQRHVAVAEQEVVVAVADRVDHADEASRPTALRQLTRGLLQQLGKLRAVGERAGARHEPGQHLAGAAGEPRPEGFGDAAPPVGVVALQPQLAQDALDARAERGQPSVLCLALFDLDHVVAAVLVDAQHRLAVAVLAHRVEQPGPEPALRSLRVFELDLLAVQKRRQQRFASRDLVMQLPRDRLVQQRAPAADAEVAALEGLLGGVGLSVAAAHDRSLRQRAPAYNVNARRAPRPRAARPRPGGRGARSCW